ncbi:MULTISPECIES: M48 family metallopeptidase [unclassified Variovorax]|uniref:M48 family metallopeptidase n=1 Tax=unclassified Variovorax TaxID=663243 RepID=UPI001BD1D5BD|nr:MULTISPECIES: M48 family metallopeptidase [unclassified Variovorax]
MNASLLFTSAFAAALLVDLLLKFWLASRQIRHVAKNRNVVPADYASAITLESHQKAADYTIAKARFGLIEVAWGAALLLAWTLLGGVDLLNKALLAWLGGGMVQQLALLGAFTAIGSLLELPFALWRTFVLEERFGFNKMTWKRWVLDALIKAGLFIAFGLPITALVLWLMGATGALWWIWAWGAVALFMLLAQLVYPNLIAPLFNKFKPLDDPTIKARVTALLKRCGFVAKGLFVMDGSTRSTHSNAYFTGFGANKRVVFYDTLLRQLSAGEMEAVLAHELGHYKRHHIIKALALSFTMSLIGFALLGWLCAQSWFYTGLGVQPNMAAPNNGLALLLFMLAIPVFTFLIGPLFAQFSRRNEFEADAYAVAQTNGNDLRAALLKLYDDNKATLTPDPVFVKFYYSHPPASERLARMAAS